jgi:hypothetical protein
MFTRSGDVSFLRIGAVQSKKQRSEVGKLTQISRNCGTIALSEPEILASSNRKRPLSGQKGLVSTIEARTSATKISRRPFRS